MGAELFHAQGSTDRERETDMTKLIVTFGNFVNAPKNQLVQRANNTSINAVAIVTTISGLKPCALYTTISKFSNNIPMQYIDYSLKSTKSSLRQACCLPCTLTCTFCQTYSREEQTLFSTSNLP